MGILPCAGCLGSVAQLVERSTENRKVTGSMPVGATKKTPDSTGIRGFFYALGEEGRESSDYILTTSDCVAPSLRATATASRSSSKRSA